MTANNIDLSIARLQAIALACTSVSIKSAPTYPVDNAEPTPFSIAHVVSGEINSGDATYGLLFTDVSVDFFFSRNSLLQTYGYIDAIVKEYSARLIGDPTLAGNIPTISFPVPFTVEPKKWNDVPYIILAFQVRIKTNENAQATT